MRWGEGAGSWHRHQEGPSLSGPAERPAGQGAEGLCQAVGGGCAMSVSCRSRDVVCGPAPGPGAGGDGAVPLRDRVLLQVHCLGLPVWLATSWALGQVASLPAEPENSKGPRALGWAGGHPRPQLVEEEAAHGIP